MDFPDPNIMGSSDPPEEIHTPTTVDSKNKTNLDQNVEKLVGNISSWFTGFAKMSQDSITQARKEMENRGGIVNYAKSEFAKLDSSIEEAQKKAHENAESNPLPATSAEDAFLQLQSENSKGKQRAFNDLESTTAGVESVAGGDATTTGPALGASLTSLFSKITSDPRISQLQHSLTATLQSISTPANTATQPDADGTERATGPTPIKIQESLSKLSLTIQSHLPHLDLKESQQLASKYLHATETYAREIQSDMKEFVGELVRIVPPDEEDKAHPATGTTLESVHKDTTGIVEVGSSNQASAKASTPVATDSATSATKVLATSPVQDEEDFAWDGEDDEAAAAAVAANSQAAALSASKTATSASVAAVAPVQDKRPVQEKADDVDEDSDWE